MVMMKNSVHPVRGETYTVREIYEDLFLRDSPHLSFFREDDEKDVIQNSHFTIDELLSLNHPLLDCEFTYVRETDEWIPVFNAVDDALVLKCVSKEQDPWGDMLYVPIGIPRC